METNYPQDEDYGDDYGQTLFEWEVPEYVEHQRETGWYILMIIVAIALVVYCIIIANFPFALIIILAVFIVFLRIYSPAQKVSFKITEDGVQVGSQFIEYDKINNFYIVYKPPHIKKLFINLKSFMPDVSIPLFDNNPLAIRTALLQYLKEDLSKKHESIDDQLEAIFKL